MIIVHPTNVHQNHKSGNLANYHHHYCKKRVENPESFSFIANQDIVNGLQ